MVRTSKYEKTLNDDGRRRLRPPIWRRFWNDCPSDGKVDDCTVVN